MLIPPANDAIRRNALHFSALPLGQIEPAIDVVEYPGKAPVGQRPSGRGLDRAAVGVVTVELRCDRGAADAD